MKNQIRNLDLWLRSIHRSIVWKQISKKRLASVSHFDLSAMQRAEIRLFYKRYNISPPLMISDFTAQKQAYSM